MQVQVTARSTQIYKNNIYYADAYIMSPGLRPKLTPDEEIALQCERIQEFLDPFDGDLDRQEIELLSILVSSRAFVSRPFVFPISFTQPHGLHWGL